MSSVPTSGELNIVIQMPETAGGDVGSPQTPSSTSPQKNTPVPADPTKGDKNSQVLLATAVQTAKTLGTQAVNAAVSTIGISTGNYYAQQKTQTMMGVASTIASLAVAASNPVTLAVAVGGMAISYGTEYYKQTKEREFQNYQSAQMAKRLGYTVARK